MGININKKPGNVVPFSDLKATAGCDSEWIIHCQKDGPKVVNNVSNALLALRTDPQLSKTFAFDEMLQITFLMAPLPGDESAPNFTPRPLTDHDVTRVQDYLQLCGLMRIGKDLVHQAIDLRAVECRFHPVRQFLKGLKMGWCSEGRYVVVHLFGGRKDALHKRRWKDVLHRDGRARV
jgi:predicted P-loop ATPase